MPLFENHVGISVSLDALRLVELVYTDNEFLLENVDELKFDKKIEPSVIDENFIDILQFSFKELISKNSLTSKNLSFSLSPEFFQILEVPFENTLLKEDLADQFKWELSKIKPFLNADEQLIQHIELEKTEANQQSFAAVLYLDKKIVNTLGKLAQSNDFKLRYVDYSQSSGNIFIRYLNKSFGSSGLSLIVSDNNLAIMILEDYKPVILRKKNFNGESSISETLTDLVTELKNSRIDLDTLSYSYLMSNKLINDIESILGFEIKFINPFDVIKLSEKLSIELDLQDNPSRFAPAAGVALRLL